MCKKTALVFVLVILVCCSCIKKNALRYDPALVGTWVSNSDSVNTWLIIKPGGEANYSCYGNNEGSASGIVDYSLFETKMWIGHKKFKISKWITGRTDGVSTVKTKEIGTLKDTTYRVDMKMVLKTTVFSTNRTIFFYRIRQ